MEFKLDSVCPLLQVYDMARALAFYRDVLGFRVKLTDANVVGDECDWAMLTRDGMTIMLNTAYERDKCPATPDAARVRAHADTVLFFGCDVDAVYSYLRDKGLSPKPPQVRPYGMKQLYVADPDGYSLCFQQPV